MARCAEALGARGADVVLLQHLEHRRAGDARDQRDIDAAERDRGQDQVLAATAKGLADRRVALHRQPFELQREHVGQQIADHEDRHREAEHRERHDGAVDPGAGLPRREHADRHRDRIASMSVTTISDSVGSMRCAIMAVTGRLVKIDVPRSPCRICHTQSPNWTRNGRSSPRLWRMRSTSAGRRLVARDHRGRIARRDVEQAEHEQRDDRHHGNGREDTPDDVGEHVGYCAVMRSSIRPRRTASGPSRCR